MIGGSGAKIWGPGPIVGAFGSRFVGLSPRFGALRSRFGALRPISGTQGQHLGLLPTACEARIGGSGAKIEASGEQYWGL